VTGMIRMSKVVMLVAAALVVGMLPLQLNAQSMPMTMAKLPLNPPTWYHGDTWAWTGPAGGVVAMTV